MTNSRVLVAIIALVVLLAGCSASPRPALPTTAPATSQTPTPTPAPEARQPFGGDCSAAVSAETLRAIFDGLEPIADPRNLLTTVGPDVAASTALLGGLTCTWSADGATVPSVSIALFPASAVPENIAERESEFGCREWLGCGRAELRTDSWIHAIAPRRAHYEAEPPPDERDALAAAVDAILQELSSAPSEQLVGVPTTPDPDRWPTLPCEDLSTSAATAAGWSSPVEGFPGDDVPRGTLWEILMANGLVEYCALHTYENGDAEIIEINVQPGAAGPEQSQLEAAGATPISVAGADAAYRMQPGGPETASVLVVAGTNRLTVGQDHAEAVATALLARLDTP